MEKLLTQEEIDALLRGVAEGEIETEGHKASESGTVRAYDLTNQDRIIRGRMPTMEIINDRFAREATASLFRFLGRMAEVKIEAFESIKYVDFLKKLPAPVSLNLFRTEPFRGTSLFFVDARLIFVLVDILFGGQGKVRTDLGDRDFTAMEYRIIRKLVDLLLADLQKAWSILENMTFTYVRTEQNPQFANFVAPSDIVLATTFQVELEWERGCIGYCIPYSTVEPIKDRLYGRFVSEYAEIDQTMRQRIIGHLLKVPLDISVEAGSIQVPLSKLLDLKAGDVVRLEQSPRDPLLLKIEGKPRGVCVAGQKDGSYAVEVLSVGPASDPRS
jgi:flagellar motor switch protein FliM